VKRGELWTAAGGKHYAGKPRPVLAIQDDRFDATASITVFPLTSDPIEIPLLRIALSPNDVNGLAAPSSIMLDKVTTMPRSKLGERIGQVSDTEMVALSRGLIVFLGLA
jgi:mRNA interferase MazF